MRAVIFTGGKQYNVGVGETLKIELLPTEDKKVVFDKVLMTFDPQGGETKVGAPYLAGAKVEAEVLGNGKAKKITVIKFHNKTHYNRKIGHRQHFTQVKITKVA